MFDNFGISDVSMCCWKFWSSFVSMIVFEIFKIWIHNVVIVFETFEKS